MIRRVPSSHRQHARASHPGHKAKSLDKSNQPPAYHRTCDTCHKRKVRCSFEKPSCAACRRYARSRGEDPDAVVCHYMPGAPRKQAATAAAKPAKRPAPVNSLAPSLASDVFHVMDVDSPDSFLDDDDDDSSFDLDDTVQSPPTVFSLPRPALRIAPTYGHPNSLHLNGVSVPPFHMTHFETSLGSAPFLRHAREPACAGTTFVWTPPSPMPSPSTIERQCDSLWSTAAWTPAPSTVDQPSFDTCRPFDLNLSHVPLPSPPQAFAQKYVGALGAFLEPIQQPHQPQPQQYSAKPVAPPVDEATFMTFQTATPPEDYLCSPMTTTSTSTTDSGGYFSASASPILGQSQAECIDCLTCSCKTTRRGRDQRNQFSFC